MKGFMISFFFIRMAEEEDEIRITVEGVTMGIKKPNKFSPLVNFYFQIEHFVGDFDIGNMFTGAYTGI